VSAGLPHESAKESTNKRDRWMDDVLLEEVGKTLGRLVSSDKIPPVSIVRP